MTGYNLIKSNKYFYWF